MIHFSNIVGYSLIVTIELKECGTIAFVKNEIALPWFDAAREPSSRLRSRGKNRDSPPDNPSSRDDFHYESYQYEKIFAENG
jgi:hypothetical protein